MAVLNIAQLTRQLLQLFGALLGGCLCGLRSPKVPFGALLGIAYVTGLLERRELFFLFERVEFILQCV
jgi:hypothetical protein